jgi:hypothetical protein
MRPRILNVAALVAVCGLFAGCCIFATQAPPDCKVELKDNALLGFYAAGWRLSGRCTQGSRYQSTFTVVVSVDVMDANGRVLEWHHVQTFPERLNHKFKNSGLGDFTLWLNQPPPPGAIVTIKAMSL